MTRLANRFIPLVAVLVLFASIQIQPFAGSAWAHGADWEVRVLGQRAGAYEVTVRTAPKPARTGRLHIEVQLIDPQTLAYVDQASVTAAARFGGGEAVASGPVRSRYRRPWHEMDLELKRSGAWDIHLAIEAAGAQAKTAFSIDVLPASASVVGDRRRSSRAGEAPQ